jgi:PadR family transcriptional regulator, regulatory protein PadR
MTDLNEKFAPIRKGLLEFVVLRVISAEKLYVAEMLQRLAPTEFATQEGTLYPLLSRLRRESLVDYEWQESESGPPRKYYRLTDTGRQALDELQGYWSHLNDTLTGLGN